MSGVYHKKRVVCKTSGADKLICACNFALKIYIIYKQELRSIGACFPVRLITVIIYRSYHIDLLSLPRESSCDKIEVG